MNDTPKRPSFFFYFLASLGVLSLVGFVFLAAVVFGAFQSLKQLSTESEEASPFSVPKISGHYIAGIKFNKQIDETYADSILKKLKSAAQDKHVSAILLEVNSPGGAVVPSQEIYDALNRIKDQKPIVSYVRGMAASGAYYSIAGSSKIIANRGSLLGSIGVIMNGLDASGLVNFLKIKPVTIKTGSLKDTGSLLRPMDETEKAYLQSLIERTRSQFAKDVQNARKTSVETMRLLSDGRVVLGTEALDLHLIDAVGGSQEALAAARGLAHDNTLEIHYYTDHKDLPSLLSQSLSSHLPAVLYGMLGLPPHF